MKRVVVDTNIFISAIGWGGIPLKILRLWKQDRFSLIISPDIIKEIDKVIEELGLSKELWGGWEKLILEKAHLIASKQRLGIRLRDKQDIKFIEAAISGNASHIITGDKDLLELKEFEGIQILTPKDFLEIF